MYERHRTPTQEAIAICVHRHSGQTMHTAICPGRVRGTGAQSAVRRTTT